MSMARESPNVVTRYLRSVLGRQTAYTMTDAELLARFADHQDEAAFELLVWRHERMVHNVCRRVVRQEQDAADACQAAFLTLACKARSIGKREALAGWLYKVAHRIAVRTAAAAAKRERHEIHAARQRSWLMKDDAALSISLRELRAALDEEVSLLPTRFRGPVVLCYLEGKTNEEAAVQLGCPTGTVVTWLAQARRLLRTRLARRGIDATSVLLPLVLASEDRVAASSATFVEVTVQAAVRFTKDRTAAGLVSPRVARLARDILGPMLVRKYGVGAAVFIVLCLAGAGSGVFAYRAADSVGHTRQAKLPDNPNEPASKAKAPNKTQQGAEKTITRSFKTGPSPKVLVETFEGAIQVQADAPDGVFAQLIEKGSSSTAQAAGFQHADIAMSQDRDTVQIVARRRPGGAERNPRGVSAVLHVPPDAILDLRTSNGSLEVQGPMLDLKVATSNTAIPVQVKATKSEIRVQDFNGALWVRTCKRAIWVTAATGSLDLDTCMAPIDIQAENATVSASTCNSEITFCGRLAGGKHFFTNRLGRIRVTLPADARLALDARTTLTGSIHNDFIVSGTDYLDPHHLKATIGDMPQATLELRTSIAPIEVGKKP
jgi:RNA polymerase sigma factor (sigma-70 family)